MAYFTRNKMVMITLDMFEANNRFAWGSTGDKAEDLKILIACQQKALAIGEYLESLGTDYSDIVSLYEDYCNCVYEIAENLDDDTIVRENYLEISRIMAIIVPQLQNRIVEISSIDVYDFTGLVETSGEKLIVKNEINRLINNFIVASGDEEEGEEYYCPLRVGSY